LDDDRITRAYRRLARSRRLVDAALWVRNIATVLAGHRLTDGFDPERNGELWFLRQAVPDARVVLDVGANLGNWAAPALAAGPRIERLVAYEPSHATALELTDRFAGDDRVEVVEAAVSDAPGEATLWEEPGHGETTSLAAGPASVAAAPRTVRVVTLDDELRRLAVDFVDLLKVDAEGYDLHVLRGAGELLGRQAIGVIQFEYNAPWLYAGSTLHAALALLRGHGYEPYLLKRSGLHRYDEARYGELFWYANFVALSPAAQPRFRPLVGPEL
jgi:FkbM family methyltransferase